MRTQNGGRTFLSAEQNQGGMENPPSCLEGDSGEDWGKSEWQTCAVPDSFVMNKVGRENQIPAKDIAEIGRFPVVDQGQDFIAGYCDDGSKVIDFDLPLIIFGDHTRCFKFVDFPFVLGADGTKVLLPNKKLYDPKFYYFAMLALELPSRGYNRHFKTLKERSLPLPPLPEQKKIAYILSTVQRAIEAQERIIQTTNELKKALMHKLFTEGLRNEPQKQTEIGPVPESWEVVPLGELVNFVTGKLNSNAAVEDGKYPFFTCSKETFWIDQYAFDTEAILLSGNNAQAIYSVKHYQGKFNAYQRTYVITIKDTDRISYHFLAQMLSRSLERLRTISIGSSTKYLTLGLLTNLRVAIPTRGDGLAIGEWLNTVDEKLKQHEAKRKSLQDLFRTLLHELMTAKTRVHALEIKA